MSRNAMIKTDWQSTGQRQVKDTGYIRLAADILLRAFWSLAKGDDLDKLSALLWLASDEPKVYLDALGLEGCDPLDLARDLGQITKLFGDESNGKKNKKR